MRILFLADVMGRPGRSALAALLSPLLDYHRADFCIVNCENSAAGYGVTPATAQELLDAGAHCLTSGNHVWAQKEARPMLDQEERLLRPANYPAGAPGRGAAVYSDGDGTPILVINLQGRTFMEAIDCPFRTADAVLERFKGQAAVIFVDFHAEATSEKQAMGWHLDGRVSAVVGTHTHVQTSDDRVLPRGTGYLSDAGMCGALDSVIGMDKDMAVNRFLSGIPARFQVPKGGSCVLQGVILEADNRTGQAVSLERIHVVWQPGSQELG